MNFRFSDLDRFLAYPEIPCTEPGFGAGPLGDWVTAPHSVKIRASVLPFSAGAPGIFLSSSEPACPASSVANSSPSSTESFEQAFPLISSTSSRAAVLRGPAPLGIRQRFGFARPSEILMLRILKDFLALFRKKAYVLLLKLMLRGGGTFSPLRCRCRRSSWSMARYSCLSK